MNTYYIAIYSPDLNTLPFIKEVSAKSLKDCEERLVRWIYDTWTECDFESEELSDLREELIQYYDTYIGEIETLS